MNVSVVVRTGGDYGCVLSSVSCLPVLVAVDDDECCVLLVSWEFAL
jgi:hypothetical protein